MPDLIVRQRYETPEPTDRTGARKRLVVAFTVGSLGPYERPFDAAGFNLNTALASIASEFTGKGFGTINVKKPA